MNLNEPFLDEAINCKMMHFGGSVLSLLVEIWQRQGSSMLPISHKNRIRNHITVAPAQTAGVVSWNSLFVQPENVILKEFERWLSSSMIGIFNPGLHVPVRALVRLADLNSICDPGQNNTPGGEECRQMGTNNNFKGGEGGLS